MLEASAHSLNHSTHCRYDLSKFRSAWELQNGTVTSLQDGFSFHVLVDNLLNESRTSHAVFPDISNRLVISDGAHILTSLRSVPKVLRPRNDTPVGKKDLGEGHHHTCLPSVCRGLYAVVWGERELKQGRKPGECLGGIGRVEKRRIRVGLNPGLVICRSRLRVVFYGGESP